MRYGPFGTALQAATRRKLENIVRFLIEHKVEVNHQAKAFLENVFPGIDFFAKKEKEAPLQDALSPVYNSFDDAGEIAAARRLMGEAESAPVTSGESLGIGVVQLVSDEDEKALNGDSKVESQGNPT